MNQSDFFVMPSEVREKQLGVYLVLGVSILHRFVSVAAGPMNKVNTQLYWQSVVVTMFATNEMRLLCLK